MVIKDQILSTNEYFNEVFEKNTIYIHHTAGGHRPDYTINSWEKDHSKTGGRLPVATAYVIGGMSTTDGNGYYDGIIYRAFDDKFWAHHLGTEQVNNKLLNQQSIGIEICNYGPITKTRDGIFLNYVNKPVPAEMVAELTEPFRGFKYYHKYTAKQLAALKELILDIAKRHSKIDIKRGLQPCLSMGTQALEVNQAAIKGLPGIWSHTNVRKDKFDVWPQPELFELIKSL